MAGLLTRGLGLGTPLVLHGLGASSATTPPDLIAACLAQLRSYNGGCVAAAFGEALPGTRKLFSTPAVGRPALPYLTFGEPGALREWFGLGNWIDRGTVDMHVYATGKAAGRSLASQAAQALNDAPLTFTGGTLLRLRVANAPMVAPEAVTVGAALAYRFVYAVDFWVQGQG